MPRFALPCPGSGETGAGSSTWTSAAGAGSVGFCVGGASVLASGADMTLWVFVVVRRRCDRVVAGCLAAAFFWRAFAWPDAPPPTCLEALS